MRTIHAKLKSEYSYCLHKLIDESTSEDDRLNNFIRMKVIEHDLAKECDEIRVIVTTKNSIKNLPNNTSWLQIALPMTESDISNTSQ